MDPSSLQVPCIRTTRKFLSAVLTQVRPKEILPSFLDTILTQQNKAGQVRQCPDGYRGAPREDLDKIEGYKFVLPAERAGKSGSNSNVYDRRSSIENQKQTEKPLTYHRHQKMERGQNRRENLVSNLFLGRKALNKRAVCEGEVIHAAKTIDECFKSRSDL